jgi:hypothetical protein
MAFFVCLHIESIDTRLFRANGKGRHCETPSRVVYTGVDIDLCDREAVNNLCDREAVNARSGKRQFLGIPRGLDHVHQLIENLGEFARLQRGRPRAFLAVQYGRQP